MLLPFLYPEVVWVLGSSPCRTYPPLCFSLSFCSGCEGHWRGPWSSPAVPSCALQCGAGLLAVCFCDVSLPALLPSSTLSSQATSLPDGSMTWDLLFCTPFSFLACSCTVLLYCLTISLAQITFLSFRSPAKPPLSDQGAVLLQTSPAERRK